MRVKTIKIAIVVLLVLSLLIHFPSASHGRSISMTENAVATITKGNNEDSVRTSDVAEAETFDCIPTTWISTDGSLPNDSDDRKNAATKESPDIVIPVEPPDVNPDVYVLVNPSLYSSISASIASFVNDLQSNGFSPMVFAQYWEDAASVRSLLQTGLSGCLRCNIFALSSADKLFI